MDRSLDRHMQLTPHFTLKEFTRSDTARARQVDNTPSPAAAAILPRLAQPLEQGDRGGVRQHASRLFLVRAMWGTRYF